MKLEEALKRIIELEDNNEELAQAAIRAGKKQVLDQRDCGDKDQSTKDLENIMFGMLLGFKEALEYTHQQKAADELEALINELSNAKAKDISGK